ncbi:MAG: hypothetical protein WCZ23_02135 [Rhodospirillaceae bacterium]
MSRSTPHTSASPHDAPRAIKVLSTALAMAVSMEHDLRKAGLCEEAHLLSAFRCSVEQRLDSLGA